MIVCICNNVSDRKIRQAVHEGMSTMTELRDNLEVAACCGKCHACAKQVLRECLSSVAGPDSHPARPTVLQRVALAA